MPHLLSWLIRSVRRPFVVLGLTLLAGARPAPAQTSPARGPLLPLEASASSDDRQLADYLGLLQQISPAAEGGARTYLAALHLRCGRLLDTAALRRAIAQDGGDPVLIGLIRAAATQDQAERQRWVAQLTCAQQGRP